MTTQRGLAPPGDPRQRKRVRGNRELIVWVGALLAAAVAYFVWHGRAVEIGGRVALQSWDGGVSVPESAQALVYTRPALKRFLRQQLAALPEVRTLAEARGAEARRIWREKAAAREEVMKILRVAERANAADLPECRARFAEVEAAANEAFAELERRTAELEEVADPAAMLSEMRGAVAGAEVGADGRFVLRTNVGQRPVLVVLVPAGEAGPGQAWLQRVDAWGGGVVEVELSNANLLTMAGLREFLGE